MTPHVLKPVQFRDMMERIADHYLSSGLTVDEVCNEFRSIVLTSALRESGGNISRCAAKHNIHRNTVARRIQAFGIKIQKDKKLPRRTHVYQKRPKTVAIDRHQENLYSGG